MSIRRMFYRIFKRYQRLAFCCVSYSEGDRLIKDSVGKPERERWVLAIPEEDYNHVPNIVCLERRERLTGEE